MNYQIKSIKVKSSWFDWSFINEYHVTNDKRIKTKKKFVGSNTIQLIGHKSFNLYLNLYRFQTHTIIENNLHTKDRFITSISLLRKATGYRSREIFDHLKTLKNNEIIDITNISRWDYITNDHHVLVIEAVDIPITERKSEKDFPIDENNYYISIPTEIIEHYKGLSLNERYIVFYCLLNRLSNNVERKASMSIEKMAQVIGVSKNHLNDVMIKKMEELCLLQSYNRNNNKGGIKFEYILARNLHDIEILKKEKSLIDNPEDPNAWIKEIEIRRAKNRHSTKKMKEELKEKYQEEIENGEWGVPDIMEPFDEEEEYH